MSLNCIIQGIIWISGSPQCKAIGRYFLLLGKTKIGGELEEAMRAGTDTNIRNASVKPTVFACQMDRSWMLLSEFRLEMMT